MAPPITKKEKRASVAVASKVISGRIEKRKSGVLDKWDPTKVVTLVAGPNKKPLITHKDHACHYSPVLSAAFNGAFLEGETQTYALPFVSTGTVSLLIKWFYTQTIELSQLTLPYKEVKSAKPMQDRQLVELWVLADNLIIPELQNQVIRLIEGLRAKHKRTCTKSLAFAWENTTEESPLRKLMLQQCAFNVTPGWFTKNPDHFSKEFLLDLVKLMSENIPESEKLGHTKARKIEDYEVEVPIVAEED